MYQLRLELGSGPFTRHISVGNVMLPNALSKSDILYFLTTNNFATDVPRALKILDLLVEKDNIIYRDSDIYLVTGESHPSSGNSGRRKPKDTILHSGTLLKKGLMFWNQRHFVLRPSKLAYFTSPVSNQN
jgi:hypothetical protein